MSYLKLRTKHKKWNDDLFFGTDEPNFYRQLADSTKVTGKYTFDGSVLVIKLLFKDGLIMLIRFFFHILWIPNDIKSFIRSYLL